MRRRVVWQIGRIAVTLLCCAACQSAEPEESATERAFVESQWRILWEVGGSDADTTVLMPSQVLADGEQVYVLEGALHRIVALDLADGRVRWVLGGRGSGPEEFGGISSFVVDTAGRLLVTDAANGRIAVVTREGTVQRHIQLPELGYPHGICGFADGRILLSVLAAEHPLVVVSPEGRVERRLALPWPDARRKQSLAVQGRLASSPRGDECIYTLTYGRGFVRLAPGERPVGHAYVEEIELPSSEVERDGGTRTEQLGQRTEAVRGLAYDAEGIAIGFVGRSEDAGRLIDRYDGPTGGYRSTVRTPFYFDRVTRLGSRYVFITRRDGYPAVVAAELLPGS